MRRKGKNFNDRRMPERVQEKGRLRLRKGWVHFVFLPDAKYRGGSRGEKYDFLA
jgi:hypothetical protein